MPLALRTACFATVAFRTVVHVPPAPFFLGPESRALFLGSCFAENIGERLRQGSMDTLVNPSHGITYNPMSLAATLERIASATPYSTADLHACERDPARLFSWEHHSRFGGRAGCDTELARINDALAQAHAHLRGCDVIFLTLGTAWAFTRGGVVVNNCHKQAAATFERQLVSADSAAAALERAVHAARAVAPPGLRVVLTVSPVRHWKDGPIDNSLSKATLLVAAHELVRTLARAPGGHACYFPSYEIMLDDLRDYRFYAADMLHPSDVALEHIWGLFSAAYLAPAASERIAAVEAVRRAARHRPMDAGSDASRQFANAQLRKVAQIEERWGPKAAAALAAESAHFEQLSQATLL